jgi:hypothetical protein
MKQTAKEKAQELVKKMSMGEKFEGSLELMDLYPVPKNKYARECALNAVDETLYAIQDLAIDEVNWNYWQEVKKEIKKL